MCSAPAFCAWCRLPLISLKLLIGVCVRDGLVASVCVYCTSAASVELRPRGWRAVAFPCWLHLRDRSGSPWLIVILMVRCCFGGLCDETGLLLVCACRTFAAPVELLPWGWRARRRFPSVSVASGSKLLAVAHCSLFIVASTLSIVFWLHWP